MAKKRVKKENYSESFKKKILNQFPKSTLNIGEFCKKNKISRSALYTWQKAYEGRKPSLKGKKKGGPYSPNERKAAVEAFLKSRMNQKDFAKTWGCSSKTILLWCQQYQRSGHRGLEGSSFKGEAARKRGAKGISTQLKKQIVDTKTENASFGLRKVRDFLRRFRGLEVSAQTISKTLKENNIPLIEKIKKKTRSSDKIRTFERALPMQLWQTDITSYVLTRQSQRVYLTVFMDDCSRYVVAWSLQLMQTSEFVMNTLLNGIQKFGKPEEVLTDQGRQYFAWRGKSKFQNLLKREGIEHVVARSHHPQTVGKCERFWETVGKEFWERVRPQMLDDARERLGHFINFYNHFRPHQGIDGMVPADRFFGVENEVRKVLEETIEKNSLRLALDQVPRTPVFLIGQIGNTPLSMHGESGRLILQTPDGSIQRLSYENFGHNLTKGISHGTESRDNNSKGTQTERETQESDDSTEASTAGEDTLEISIAGREDTGPSQRDCVDGVLDWENEQARDCQEAGDTSSSDMATISAGDIRNACGASHTTENEIEGADDEHRRRHEEDEEENSGAGEDRRDAGSIDRNSPDDAGLLRREDADGGTVGEGEYECKDAGDIEESFGWPWQNFFAREKGSEEK